MNNTLVIATGNKGKLAEIQDIISPLGWHVRSQQEWAFPEAEETGLTFIENAIIKARHACRHTGLAALADDSGLEVDALQGAPGIYSARYAGSHASDADNNAKLLAALAEVPDARRSARFHCVMVLLRHAEDPTPLVCHGQWEGRLLHAPRGEGGFGYDPLFWVPEQGCSSAELPKAMKNTLSHRAQALRALTEQLTRRPQWLG